MANKEVRSARVEPNKGGGRMLSTGIAGMKIGSRAFASDEKGTIAIVFGLTAFVVVGLVGGALDFGRAFSAREQVQTALDSAVLAAARVLQIEDKPALAKETGQAFLGSNMPKGGMTTTVSDFVVDETRNTISVSASVMTAAPFLSVLGLDKIDMHLEAGAQLARGASARRNLEISLMLDTTGSMSGNKLTSMKSAAKDLIDIVVWEDQSTYRSRVALVPFAEAVRPGPAYLNSVRGNRPSSNRFSDGNGNWQQYKLTDCVSDRKGDKALTDAAPTGNDKAGPVYTRTASCTPGKEVMPLTSEKQLLKDHIDSFSASGLTAGQIGTQWAWYALSPNWNSIWPDHAAAAYGDSKTLKVAVLMSDGEYNVAYDDAGVATRDSLRNASNGSPDGQARLLCNAMKAQGIAVFTIGFDLASANASETLRSCATDPSYYYDAKDADKLKLAFRDIALRLATFHLSH